MLAVNIRIQTIEEGKRGAMLLPELVGKDIVDTRIEYFTILEGGMESGKASVGIVAPIGEGKYAIIQTSADMLRGLVSALHGAEMRFADEKAKKQ